VFIVFVSIMFFSTSSISHFRWYFFSLSDTYIFYPLSQSQQNEFCVFLWTKKRPGAFSIATRQLVIPRGSPADGAAASASFSGQPGVHADFHGGRAPGWWERSIAAWTLETRYRNINEVQSKCSICKIVTSNSLSF